MWVLCVWNWNWNCVVCMYTDSTDNLIHCSASRFGWSCWRSTGSCERWSCSVALSNYWVTWSTDQMDKGWFGLECQVSIKSCNCVCVFISVCVGTCMCLGQCVGMCLCLDQCVGTCVSVSVWAHACVSVSVWAHACVSVSVWTHACVSVSVWACACVFMAVLLKEGKVCSDLMLCHWVFPDVLKDHCPFIFLAQTVNARNHLPSDMASHMKRLESMDIFC